MPGEVPPFVPPDGVRIVSDVVYGMGGGRQLKADLYVPEGEGKGRIGTVFIHGGGWRGGTRNQFRRHAAHMATRGCVGLCIEYRYSGAAKFPAAVEDAKCAVRWMRAHAEDYAINTQKIAAVGGSAGAHLAAMLGTTDASAGLEGKGGHDGHSSKVNAMVLFNGAFNLTKLPALPDAGTAVREFLGGDPDDIPQVYALASPITHIDPSTAPSLLLHGTSDALVPWEQSVSFKEHLEEAGVQAELFTAEGAAHGFFNRPPHFEPMRKRMEAFILKTLAR